MPIPNQSRVQEILGHRHDLLAGFVTRAWERWQKNPEKSQLYLRTRACLMHNYIMLDAIANLPLDTGIKAVDRHESALFLIDDELVVRFKKGDCQGLSSNIGTQAALEFNDPSESMSLLGVPDLVRLDIAYVLNDLATKIQDVLVVARDGDRVIWKYSILQGAAEAGATTQLPIDPQTPPAADSGMRVPGQEDEKQQNDGAR